MKQYRGGDVVCSAIEDVPACNAIILGSLIKALIGEGLWPTPKPPYKDLTFGEIASKIEGLRIVSLCGKIEIPRAGLSTPEGHELQQSVAEEIAFLEEHLDVLDINAFNKGAERNLCIFGTCKKALALLSFYRLWLTFEDTGGLHLYVFVRTRKWDRGRFGGY